MTESTSIQENQEKEVGSYEWLGAVESDHYCVGHSVVSLLSVEQVCLDLASYWNNA
jgi:hypothetical protein